LQEQDIREIVGSMTLREKAGQLRQKLYGFSSYVKNEDGSVEPSEAFTDEVEKCQGLGFLYGLLRSDPWSKKDYGTGLTGVLAPKTYNMLQSYVMEHSRFNIPMLVSSECPHGNQILDGYLLPVNLAAGASFNPELLQKAASVSGKQLRTAGTQMALMSMLDVLRDPRWGRSEECYSEDPFLTARMASAAVKGMQSSGISCCAKHFAAQGQTTGGVNASSALIGENEFREIHMPAAVSAVSAGCDAVMAAYNDIDGVPCHANEKLLRGILRDEIGFNGLIMADGVALDRLTCFTGSDEESAAAALRAGIDVGLWDSAYDHLEEAVEKDEGLNVLLDEAVFRILMLKNKAGLFDEPFVPENDSYVSCISHDDIETDLELAEESVVLLKNDNVLPLKKGQHVAVTGPAAGDIYRMCGDYTPYLRDGSYCTILQGLVESGCVDAEYIDDVNDIKYFKDEAKDRFDAIILCIGGSSSRFDGANFDSNGAALDTSGLKMDCGEGVDLSSIELDKHQYELVRSAASLGIPVITIVVAGRPYALKDIPDSSDSLIYSFYPGPFGGRAISDILTGVSSPSGILPVSIPFSADQLPVYYNYRISYEAMKYADRKSDKPMYTFGYGLSYSKFEYSDIVKSCDDSKKVSIQFNVKNTGDMDSLDTVLLYVRKRGMVEHKIIVPRNRELSGFTKLRLAVGEEQKIEIQTQYTEDEIEKIILSDGRGDIISI
jgi:beta-glucosidase